MKTVTVGQLGKIITGNTPPRKQPDLYGKATIFIKPTDICENSKYTYSPEECYSEKGVSKYRTSLIPKGATCVVTIGSIGKKMTMAHTECFINQAMNAIIPNEDYDSEYVYYLLKNNLSKLKSLDSGTSSGRENVSKSAFSNMELQVVESQDAQKKIGKILAAYDDLIENNQTQIKLLEESAKRLYKEWFVNLRFPGHENTNIVDGVPAGWGKTTIEKVCQTVGGGTPSTKNRSFYEGGNIPWVTPTDITRNNCIVLLDTEKKITEAGLKGSSTKLLPPETILMTSRASVGYFGLCEMEVCTNQGFISCIPNNEIYGMYLLYNLIYRTDEIRQKAGGATYLEISKSTFRGFELLLPDDITLVKFQDYVYPMIKEIRVLKKQIGNCTQARDRLLPKLISGEIEV